MGVQVPQVGPADQRWFAAIGAGDSVMGHGQMMLQRSKPRTQSMRCIAAALATVAAFGASVGVRADDCDENGIDDRLDLRGALRLSATRRLPVATSYPVRTIAADLNGDGYDDLILLRSESAGNGTFSVYLSKDATDFEAYVEYGTGLYPESIVAADFDGDGSLDLAVGNSGGDYNEIFRNNGDGTFGSTQHLEKNYNTQIETLLAGDVDGDGDTDVVGFHYGAYLFKKNGDGSFTRTLLGSNSYFAGTLADLDSDGDLDLVLGPDSSDNDLLTYRNNGAGEFSSWRRYSLGRWPRDLTTADLNADGHPDLIGLYYDKYDGHVGVLLNKGDGTFNAVTGYTTGNVPECLAVADLDGDGDLDLATGNASSHNVSLFFNQGDGKFADKIDFSPLGDEYDQPIGIVPIGPGTDEARDLAIAITNQVRKLVIVANEGDGTFVRRKFGVGSTNLPVSMTFADLNGDGLADLAVATKSLSHNLVLW